MSRLNAWMLGDPGLMPFSGHFRLRIAGARARGALCGRIAADLPPEEAFRISRRLARVLGAALDDGWTETDRHGLMRRVWQLLKEVPDAHLGPACGDDLSLLLIAEDDRGVGITGVGLSAAWAVVQDQLRPLVPAGHPLLARAGRPASLPGVLTLDAHLSRVIGAPAHLDPVLPPAHALLARCGVRIDAPDARP